MPFKKGNQINKGRIHSEDRRRRSSLSHKGIQAWNKGLKLSDSHREKLRQSKLMKPTRYWLGKKRSEDTIQKLSKAGIGKVVSPETCRKLSIALKGKVVSEETRRKISLSRRGENSPFWRGGKTKENKIIRMSLEYRLWRESVFKRDDWTCIMCKKRGGELHPDHIKPFAYFPELRFDIDNGRTLCAPCHKKTDTYGHKARKNHYN